MACSDSRVVPNVFASTNPGNLFVVRNVGNLIPKPNEQDHTTADESEVAAIEFGILQLGVKNIIVCGHSECGAMLGLLNNDDVKHKCDAQCIHVRMPHLSAWLRHGYESLHKFKRMISSGETPTFSKGSGGTEIRAKINKNLSPHNQLSQINVLQQLENISKYK
jgi:carbonic anhydrase